MRPFAGSAMSLLALLAALFVMMLVQNGSAQEGDEGLYEEYLQRMDKRDPMKKSDGLSDFIGSLNGAARLRYGKRSAPMWAVNGPMQYYRAFRPFNRWQMAKRVVASNYAEVLPAGLLDQLNGAERLRFAERPICWAHQPKCQH